MRVKENDDVKVVFGFFTFPESNALQWCNDIHVKVNEKVCSTTTAVHDFSQLLL